MIIEKYLTSPIGGDWVFSIIRIHWAASLLILTFGLVSWACAPFFQTPSIYIYIFISHNKVVITQIFIYFIIFILSSFYYNI